MGAIQDAAREAADRDRRWAETNRKAAEIQANSLHVYGSTLPEPEPTLTESADGCREWWLNGVRQPEPDKGGRQ